MNAVLQKVYDSSSGQCYHEGEVTGQTESSPIIWGWFLAQDASHHQDYCIFSSGIPN